VTEVLRPVAAPSLPAWAGSAVALATTLLVCVTLHPFQSLASSASIELSSGREASTYLLLALLAAVSAFMARHRFAIAGRLLLPWPIASLAIWVALSCGVSPDPVTSVKRLALAGIMAVLGASLVLLPKTPSGLAAILGLSAGVVLFLSYAGIVVVPDLAVHQITDVEEPALAGDWRGVFAHKNDAAGVMSIFIFQGLFVARRGFAPLGWAIVAASAFFMLHAGGKSSLALVMVTLVVSQLWSLMPPRWPRVVIAFLPIVVLNLAGLGSVLLPPVGAIVHSLPVDPTFTGRDGIWQLAVSEMPGHLIMGHGFDGFWNTEATRYGGETDTWAVNASHAHNSYVDIVVSAGLPGLVLLLLAFAWQPLRDLTVATRRRADPALLMLLMRTWLFSLYLSAFETIFFHRDDPLWLFFLASVAGLRIAATFPLRDGPRGET
jgi:O-antigen ligase